MMLETRFRRRTRVQCRSANRCRTDNSMAADIKSCEKLLADCRRGLGDGLILHAAAAADADRANDLAIDL